MSKRKFRLNGSIGSSLTVGATSSLISFILTSVIAAIAIYTSGNPLPYIGIGAFVAFLVSGAISGFTTAVILPEKKILYSLLSALLFSLLLLGVGLIISGGKIGVRVLLNYICYVAVSILFAWLGSRRRRRRAR